MTTRDEYKQAGQISLVLLAIWRKSNQTPKAFASPL